MLYIQGVVRYGGALESLYQLVSHPELSPFSPLVVTSGEGLLTEKLEAAGVRHAIVPMGMWRKAKNWVRLPLTLKMLRDLAKREGISLVHCNTLWDAPYGAHLGKRLGLPVVVHLRNTFTPDKIEKYRLNKADRVIAVSKAVATPLQEWAEKVEVVHNGVDLRVFDPTKEKGEGVREELGLPRDAPILLLVGRVDTTKGQDIAITALSMLKADPHPHLLFAGEASTQEHRWPGVLRGLASELGVADRVHFLGNRNDIPRLMAAATVVLVPSLESAKEGFGRVAIEAMAMCKPVVASNTGGLPEVVVRDTGILVPPGDARALAEAVESLLNDPERSVALGEAGRKRVEELFDLRLTVSRIKEIYHQLLGEGKCPEVN